MKATVVKRRNLIPIHANNVKSGDWIVLLEANTIVGSSGKRLRVAEATQRRKVVWRLKGWKRRPFLMLEGFDPRIHVIVFCPQLYKYDHSGRLVVLRGEEIGAFIASALNHRTIIQCPWYRPIDGIADQPLINDTVLTDFDTLLVESESAGPSLVPALPMPLDTEAEKRGVHHLEAKRI